MTLPRQRSAMRLGPKMMRPPMMEGEEMGPGTPRMTMPSEAPLPKRRAKRAAQAPSRKRRAKKSKLTTVYQGKDTFRDY
jgi:hypothetical protein